MPLTLELPFGLALDLSFWEWFAALLPNQQVRVIFVLVGWAAVALVWLYMGAFFWVEYRHQTRYLNRWQWVLFAVDIPALFIQSPKAVEQIFAHLSGADTIPHSIEEKFWQGKRPKWFSFEIISIEGYIQFLIRTEAEFRDLVEAAVYAQYPEAEITEVEDYVGLIPDYYPHADYDVMGVEFKLAEADAYPIRTYPYFEYSISKDQVFSDPMAALLENFSRLGHGEHLWMQIIIESTSSSWKKKGIELVKEIVAGKKRGQGSVVESILNVPNAVARDMLHAWNWDWEAEEGRAAARPEPVGKVSELTPGLKATVEAIEEKISRIGFKSKVRALYAARKDVYAPNRCLNGLVGAMNQFHTQNRNAVVPHSKTLINYDLWGRKTLWKKNRFVRAFKKRKIRAVATPYILNIEELATIWHFPLPFVKTPLMSKASAKRAEPPPGLPVETSEGWLRLRPVTTAPPPAPPEPPLPEELPYG